MSLFVIWTSLKFTLPNKEKNCKNELDLLSRDANWYKPADPVLLTIFVWDFLGCSYTICFFFSAILFLHISCNFIHIFVLINFWLFYINPNFVGTNVFAFCVSYVKHIS